VPITLTGCKGTLSTLSLSSPTRTGTSGTRSAGMTPTACPSSNFKLSDVPPVGNYKVTAENGSTKDAVQLAWVNAPTIPLRYAATSGASAKRAGSRVTISGLVKRYGTSGWTPYAKIIVGFQHLVPGPKPHTTVWKTIGYAHTDTHGRTALRFTLPAGRYRVFTGNASPSFWGSASNSVVG